MTNTFVASVLTVGEFEELETYLIGLIDDPNNPIYEFPLQKSLFDDPQDAELGMDTYCVVLSGQGTYYGRITSCVLTAETLTVKFSQGAKDCLGVDKVEIGLNLSTNQINLLITASDIYLKAASASLKNLY